MSNSKFRLSSLVIEAINKPVEAFKCKSFSVTPLFVALTILIVTLFDPIFGYIVNSDNFITTINFNKSLLLIAAGTITYLMLSVMLWLICKAFGSKVPLKRCIHSWGITFAPNIICAFAVVFAETFFYVFWNNSIWGILLNILFGGVFIWKLTLYILFLKEVAGLRGKRLFGSFTACSIIILVLAFIDMFIGLKTPIL